MAVVIFAHSCILDFQFGWEVVLKNIAVQLFGHRTAGAQDYVFKCKVWF